MQSESPRVRQVFAERLKTPETWFAFASRLDFVSRSKENLSIGALQQKRFHMHTNDLLNTVYSISSTF